MGSTEKILRNIAIGVFKGFVIEKDITFSPDDLNSIKNILLIVRHQMGDFLCTLPMMHSLRKKYPSAEINLVSKSSAFAKEILNSCRNNPVDNIYYYENGFENFVNLVKIVKDKNPILAVVPSPVDFSSTNHLIAYYSGAKYRAGVRSKDYEKNRIGNILNIKSDFLWDTKKVHQIERNLDVIRQLGIETEVNGIKLKLNENKINFADDFFRNNFPESSKPVIGLHTGAAKEHNVWNYEKFAGLMNLLHLKTGAYFYLSEGPDDKKYADALTHHLQKNFPEIKYSKYRGELTNNAAIISKSTLFISNDTGIMHLASGLDIPVIGLFGPTNAYEWGPVGSKKVSLQAAGGNIDKIEISGVYETVIKLLNV